MGDKPQWQADDRLTRITALRPPKMRPGLWDLWVSAAYLLLVGRTQKDVAEVVGRGARQVRNWLTDPRWPLAQMAARLRWLTGIEDTARLSLEAHVPKDGWLALKVLERLDADLAPAKQGVTHEGAVTTTPPQVVIYMPNNGRRPSENGGGQNFDDFEAAARKSREAALYAMKMRGDGGDGGPSGGR